MTVQVLHVVTVISVAWNSELYAKRDCPSRGSFLNPLGLTVAITFYVLFLQFTVSNTGQLTQPTLNARNRPPKRDAFLQEKLDPLQVLKWMLGKQMSIQQPQPFFLPQQSRGVGAKRKRITDSCCGHTLRVCLV